MKWAVGSEMRRKSASDGGVDGMSAIDSSGQKTSFKPSIGRPEMDLKCGMLQSADAQLYWGRMAFLFV